MVLYVPTFITTTLSNLILRVFKVDVSNSEQAFTKVDLDDYVRDINERMEEEAEMENEIQILQNALEFNSIKVRDCMIPRTEILALNIDDPIELLVEKFLETGYSKILIYRDSIDNVIGYAHSFELFKKPKQIKNILLPISIVPEALLVKDLLEQFTKQQRTIAVVVDEFGGTSGLITVEDIIEEIFGEIEDEHDGEDLLEQILPNGDLYLSARHEISYINDQYDLDIEEGDDYNTLAGFVLNQMEEIPTEGESFSYKKYKFIVKKVSHTRIEELLIKTE